MKVLVSEKIAPEGVQILKDGGLEVEVKLGLTPDELIETIPQYDGLIVRSATKVTSDLLKHATNLKVVGRAGSGVDNIDVPACTSKGILVVNTPGSNSIAAAEIAVGLAFSIFRNIPQAYYSWKKNNDFRRTQFVGNELDGKIAGVVGLGKIGSIVASKLKGLNMDVIAYDPFITDEKFDAMGIRRAVDLKDLLTTSDLITIHMPKTPETTNMISDNEFELCKDGVKIINAARGGIVDENALYKALTNGKVSACGIDVLNVEPNYNKTPEEQDFNNPLLELDNVIFTPHLGASTHEATLNVGTEVAKQLSNALNGKIVAAYNMPSVKVNDLNEIKSYLELSETLGKLYFQTEKNTVEKIEITYSGEITNLDTKIFTLSVIKGFLEPIVTETVNYVNALNILRDMGIDLLETKSSGHEKYTNLITVTFNTKESSQSISGTCFAKDEIRIVDFYGYKLNFQPTKHMLAIQNVDIPGIIGNVGAILAAENVNIAAIQLGRKERGGKAVSFVSIDDDVNNDVLDTLRNIDNVLKVSKITI